MYTIPCGLRDKKWTLEMMDWKKNHEANNTDTLYTFPRALEIIKQKENHEWHNKMTIYTFSGLKR